MDSAKPHLSLFYIPTNSVKGCLPDLFAISDNFGEPITRHAYNIPIFSRIQILGVCTRGEIKISFGSEEYVHKANSIFVVNPQSVFKVVSCSEDYQGFSLLSTSNFLKMGQDLNISMRMLDMFSQKHTFPVSEQLVDEMVVIYNLIKQELNCEGGYKKEIVYHYCHVLILKLFYHLEGQEAQVKKLDRKQSLFNNFKVEVEKHYRKERSVQFYARQLCITPKYLSTLCFQVSGKHATEWINSYVILTSQSLLLEKKYSVKEISVMMNFPTPSQFVRYFRQITGMTPLQYVES